MLHEINRIDWLIDLLRKWWDINCLYYKDVLTQFLRLPIKNTFAKQKKKGIRSEYLLKKEIYQAKLKSINN